MHSRTRISTATKVFFVLMLSFWPQLSAAEMLEQTLGSRSFGPQSLPVSTAFEAFMRHAPGSNWGEFKEANEHLGNIEQTSELPAGTKYYVRAVFCDVKNSAGLNESVYVFPTFDIQSSDPNNDELPVSTLFLVFQRKAPNANFEQFIKCNPDLGQVDEDDILSIKALNERGAVLWRPSHIVR